MASTTLTVSDDIKSELKRFSWVNWSEIAREELVQREERTEALEEALRIVSKSKFTEKDADEMSRKYNR